MELLFKWSHLKLWLPEVFYHHRASVWGVRIQGNYIVTGSMDGTIALIDIESLTIKKHFLAHENEWGGRADFHMIQQNPVFMMVLFQSLTWMLRRKSSYLDALTSYLESGHFRIASSN